MELSLAYMAGFFDGEGCIGLYNENPLSLHVLEQIRGPFGGGISHQVTATGRTKLNWQISGRKAALFLNAMIPFESCTWTGGWWLRERRPQDAEVAKQLKDLKKA